MENSASAMCIIIAICYDGMRVALMVVGCGALMRLAGRAVVLYGRSFEFGAPEFSNLRYVNWDGIDGMERPLFYQPHWPYDETLVPIAVMF